MPRKTTYQLGMETILNNPDASFLKHPRTFGEIHNQSKMTIQQLVKHIGTTASKQKKVAEPTDQEKIEKRLGEMEAKTSA